ncbi:HpcH/HpaI aldolase family protein [Halorussus marinus]|uniref:HpcH/HpaI aldolase family protein n=1 Tax=Halorussus marinus TaxID=2505976 RepID=UPI0010921A41|nr:aldolase/citrate lyase family protein [Halorussus marinus]
MGKQRRVSHLLDEQGPILGARAATTSPSVVEVYGEMGLDFAWIDLEHAGASPFDSRVLDRLARAADAAEIDLVVRLPSGDPAAVRKVLDTGVKTLLIPRVESADEIRQAIEAARFAYDGRPGSYGAGAGRDSGWGDASSIDPSAHDEAVSVGCMIETRTAVENLDAIAAVPELGFAFVGPADLSVSIGRPFEKDHPDVRRAIAEIREACLDAGVPLGWVTDDAADAEAAIDRGYRLLRLGDEVASARVVLGSRLDSLRADSE